jgi:hypothetical protein
VVPSKPIAEAAAQMPGTKRVACFNDGFHMLLRDLKAERTWDAIEAFTRDRPGEPAPCPRG